jgi:hypothetical protein
MLMKARAALSLRSRRFTWTTMLELVQSLSREDYSEDEIVAAVLELVNRRDPGALGISSSAPTAAASAGPLHGPGWQPFPPTAPISPTEDTMLMKARAAPAPGSGRSVRTTMLELVQSLAREGRSEDEIVAAVLELVDSGQVILLGNFRGTPLQRPNEEPIDAKHPNGAPGSTALSLGEAHVGQRLAAMGQRGR